MTPLPTLKGVTAVVGVAVRDIPTAVDWAMVSDQAAKDGGAPLRERVHIWIESNIAQDREVIQRYDSVRCVTIFEAFPRRLPGWTALAEIDPRDGGRNDK